MPPYTVNIILSGFHDFVLSAEIIWPYMCVFMHKSFWTCQTEFFSESAGVPEAGECKTVFQCTYCPLWTGYSQVYICLKHPCTHTLTVACYSLLIDCFDLLDTGAVFLNLLMNGVMTWSCGVFVCVWRTIALYISTSFSTSPSFQRYYIPFRASMRERERKERRKRKEKWTRLALIREVFAEVDVVGVLCSPQPNKRLRNCLFMQIIQNNKLLAGKASTTVTSPCN